MGEAGKQLNGAGNPAQKPTSRERLVSKLGETGAVLHDAVSVVVDEKLAATAQDRGSALSAVVGDFTQKIQAVSGRVEEVEKAFTEVKRKSDAAETKAGEAAQKASAAETLSVTTSARVTELERNLSCKIPKLVEDADGKLVVKMVEEKPEDLIKSLITNVTGALEQMVSAVGKLNKRLGDLKEGVTDVFKDLGYEVEDSDGGDA